MNKTKKEKNWLGGVKFSRQSYYDMQTLMKIDGAQDWNHAKYLPGVSVNESLFEFEYSFPRVLVPREMDQQLQHMEEKGKSGKETMMEEGQNKIKKRLFTWVRIMMIEQT